MEIEGRRFLVTGGAGFIGSHLVDMLLAKGAGKVVVFDNFIRGGFHNLEAARRHANFELFKVKGDLTHQDELDEATDGIDGVFHLASLCLAHCQEYPRSALDVNVTGSYNLFEASVGNQVKRVIFASSSSIYGNAIYAPMDEAHPFENRNFYGATKIAGEAILRAFYYKYGLENLSLRFMNIYGPRQDLLGVYIAVIIKIIDRLNRGLSPIIHGDGSQSFDFVYVKDACRGLIKAMTSGQCDRAYNISSGRQVSILDLCKTIIKIMDKDIPIEFVEASDPTLVKNRIGSIERAERELGFKAATSLEDGLREVINWRRGDIPGQPS